VAAHTSRHSVFRGAGVSADKDGPEMPSQSLRLDATSLGKEKARCWGAASRELFRVGEARWFQGEMKRNNPVTEYVVAYGLD
jgi:hypothetical protein